MDLAALVSKASDGDAAAASDLCSRYAPKLRAYFVKQGVPAADLDDVLQDTLTRMLDALAKGRIRPDTFEGWLFTTAHNVHVDHVRRAMRIRSMERTGLDEAPEIAGPDPQSSPERMEAIREAVRRLPGRLREPLTLLHVHGLSYEDIAKRLEISTNAVAIRIHRARRILRGPLDDRS